MPIHVLIPYLPSVLPQLASKWPLYWLINLPWIRQWLKNAWPDLHEIKALWINWLANSCNMLSVMDGCKTYNDAQQELILFDKRKRFILYHMSTIVLRVDRDGPLSHSDLIVLFHNYFPLAANSPNNVNKLKVATSGVVYIITMSFLRGKGVDVCNAILLSLLHYVTPYPNFKTANTSTCWKLFPDSVNDSVNIWKHF